MRNERMSAHFIVFVYDSGVCLIENESGSDTTKINPYPAIGGTHPSGHNSYGLLQVNLIPKTANKNKTKQNQINLNENVSFSRTDQQ